MNKFLANLQTQTENNPVVAIGVGAAALTAVTKFISVLNDRRATRVWAKEVARRSRKLS